MERYLVSFLLVFVLCGGAYPSSPRVFQGMIIDIGASSIEIKRGSRELTLFWDESSKVVRAGAAADRGTVDICQRARARYALRGGRPVIVTLEILSGSHCRR